MHEPIVSKPTYSRFVDLEGKTFTRYTAVSYAGKSGAHQYWNCICSCGNERVVRSNHLTSGGAKSCGCIIKEILTTHDCSKTLEYGIWNCMIQRCENTNNHKFPLYGARNICICDRWRNSFQAFINDMGPRPSPDHSIDRINNDGNYEPANCRWATATMQARNTRMFSTNTSGVAGISIKDNGRFRARICANTKSINLGTYVERWDAICARKSGELTHW